MPVDGAPSALVTIRGVGLVRPDGIASPLSLPAGIGAAECLAYQCKRLPIVECLPPVAVRRLDRLQLLMLTAAGLAVRDAGIQAGPSVGVFAGTALGSLGATVEFLENMICLDEREPKPAKFINSVHNAAASAIAIQLGCKGSNHTVTHDCVSLEMAFRRAAVALEAGRLEHTIVVGGDELNGYFVAATQQLGWWRTVSQPLSPLEDTGIWGSLPGEGAAAFVLEKPGRPTDGHRAAVIRSMQIGPPSARDSPAVDVDRQCRFLQDVCDEAGVSPAEIDLMLVGANGDELVDARYRSVTEAFSARVVGPMGLGCFKQLCGEFCTASGIGLATAVEMVRSGRVPAKIRPIVPPCRPAISNVLVYNIYPNGYHSAFWVSG